MQKAKKSLVYTLKILLMVIPTLCMVQYLGYFTLNKTDTWHIPLIESQPDGEYDVIFVGPSRIMYTIQPAQLYGEYGITSCNLGTPAQSVPTSYYLIQEMIQRHDPELVVLEVASSYIETPYLELTRLHQVWDYFPMSQAKLAMIRDLVEENPEEFVFPIIKSHGRWKELIREDYVTHQSAHNETYLFLDGTTPFPGAFTPVPQEDALPVPEVPLDYLQRIVQLCRETDTQLLLTVMPFRGDLSEDYLNHQRIYNTVERLAQEWGVGYINLLHHLEEFGFDFETDMVEASHVNHSGGIKISSYFGAYLREHYDLPNRIQDPAYAHWQEDFAKYLEQLAIRQNPEA